MRRCLLPLLLALFLLPQGAKAETNGIFLALGGLKTPGIAFDVVGAAMLRPQMPSFADGSRIQTSARAAFASHLVTLGLHTVSIGALFVAGATGGEELYGPMLLVNSGCDLAIGVMGVTTGLDLLFSKATADLKGTPEGVGVTWSGVLNIAMGTFGLLWFPPTLIAGIVSAEEWSMGPGPGDDRARTIALRLRPPPLRATLAPTGAGLSFSGTF